MRAYLCISSSRSIAHLSQLLFHGHRGWPRKDRRDTGDSARDLVRLLLDLLWIRTSNPPYPGQYTCGKAKLSSFPWFLHCRLWRGGQLILTILRSRPWFLLLLSYLRMQRQYRIKSLTVWILQCHWLHPLSSMSCRLFHFFRISLTSFDLNIRAWEIAHIWWGVLRSGCWIFLCR